MNNMFVRFINNQVNRAKAGEWFFIFRDLSLLLIFPILLAVVLFARLIRPLILIRFGELITSRMGHFAANIEVYLCERDLTGQQRILDIFYVNDSICNKQLMKMWKRIMFVSSIARGFDLANRALPGSNMYRIPWRIYQDRDIYGSLEKAKIHVSFTNNEESRGELLLGGLGITKDSPFVCFLSRSPDYLKAMFPKGNWNYHNFRDSDIKNFMPAAEELTRRGYFTLRMGAVVSEPFLNNNPMIVDYATNYRTDFLDVFLGAKCRFYLGDSCGFHAIPMIFRRPLAMTNMIPLECAPTWGSESIFIPKKLWLRKEKRFLTFTEIMDSGIGRFLSSRQFEESGIEIIENTPEEIMALALEMDQRLNGEWRTIEEDEQMQRRFWKLFKPTEMNNVLRARIGTEFLRQNKELLPL